MLVQQRITLLLILIATTNTTIQENELVGEWQNKKNTVTYIFNENGTVYYNEQGRGLYYDSFTVDTTQTPHVLTLIKKQASIEHIVYALIQFEGTDKIKLEQFPPYIQQVPKTFSKEPYRIFTLQKKRY